jgi:hypothetical protein
MTSEHLGFVTGDDGTRYGFHFDGGAAVINAEPVAAGSAVVEVHREPANDASEAIVKITAWWAAKGWHELDLDRGDHCALCGKNVAHRPWKGSRAYWVDQGHGTATCPECSAAKR